MEMTEEERKHELKSFFMSHSLFGMKKNNQEDDEEFLQPIQIKKNLSINNWKNWLTQKSQIDEKIDHDDIKVSLQKKIRSMKYLEHLK